MARPVSIPLYEVLTYQQQVRLRVRLALVPHWSGDEVCVYLGCSRGKLNEIVSSGRLKRISGHGGARMFCRDEVFGLLQRNNKSTCEGLRACS